MVQKRDNELMTKFGDISNGEDINTRRENVWEFLATKRKKIYFGESCRSAFES
jgi:hypothetical protein